MIEPALVGVGGAVGACSRYALAQILSTGRFPWVTLVVNVVGSFILGLVLFAITSNAAMLLIGVGFCGAFTRFSSFSFQTVVLWKRERRALATVNALANLVCSLAAFWLAWLIAS